MSTHNAATSVLDFTVADLVAVVVSLDAKEPDLKAAQANIRKAYRQLRAMSAVVKEMSPSRFAKTAEASRPWVDTCFQGLAAAALGLLVYRSFFPQ